MELDDRIRENVAHVDLLSLAHYIRMLVHHQPPTVGEPKATIRVMGISVCFRVFMMHTMVPDPVVNCVLAGHGEAHGQDHPQRQLGFVRLVRPHAMNSTGHSETGHSAHEKS